MSKEYVFVKLKFVKLRSTLTLNVQGAAADVIDSLVVKHDGDISVLQQGVGGQHRVVGLHHSVRHLRRAGN